MKNRTKIKQKTSPKQQNLKIYNSLKYLKYLDSHPSIWDLPFLHFSIYTAYIYSNLYPLFKRDVFCSYKWEINSPRALSLFFIMFGTKW